jgi:hypothetical protein
MATTADTDLGWFEQLPRVGLHVQLEGALPRKALWELTGCKAKSPIIRQARRLFDD